MPQSYTLGGIEIMFVLLFIWILSLALTVFLYITYRRDASAKEINEKINEFNIVILGISIMWLFVITIWFLVYAIN